MKTKAIVAVFLFSSLLLSACEPGGLFGPTRTPTPTGTSKPTLTLTPANTWTPASTSTSTQTPTMTPTRTSTATATHTITPTIEPTLAFIVTSAATYRGWPQYNHTVYGFSFAAPPAWKVSELADNFIQVTSSAAPGIRLTIGIRWVDENVRIQRTGVPEGDIVLVRGIQFLGQEISKGILVYQDKEKAVLYANCVEITVGNRVFTLGLGSFGGDYAAVNLTNDQIGTADAIVESIAIIK